MEEEITGVKSDRKAIEYAAQQCAYDAMESHAPDIQLKAVRKALNLDPENPDALMIMLDLSGLKEGERLEALAAICKIAELRLGAARFEVEPSHFWLDHETRPYMRAQERLASQLCAMGRADLAVEVYEHMLTLNPNDNQGVRYHMLACSMSVGQKRVAQRLMKKYKGEEKANVVFAWCHVLNHVLHGELIKAEKALGNARAQNPFMEDLLTERKKASTAVPKFYAVGTVEEALNYLEAVEFAWGGHADAMKWLVMQANNK